MKAIDLYSLLPEHHRTQDVLGRLKALLELVEGEVDVVKRDIDGLLDDLFIETSADWVVPYIGDLVGNRQLPEGMVRPRADVAKTLYYRRRKGTLPMLEEVARDVTRWPTHAVAAFELLEWTQALDHTRFEVAPNPTPAAMVPRAPPRGNFRHAGAVTRVGTAHIRDASAMDRVDTPWDTSSHTIDMRPPSTQEGWQHISNALFFMWRLKSYPMTGVVPREATASGGTPGTRFTFSPLGNDAPLFNVAEEEFAEHGLAGEQHVPGPIRPMDFYLDVKAYGDAHCDTPVASKPLDTDRYYGHTRVENGRVARRRRILIHRKRTPGGWAPVPAWQVRAMDLSQWDEPPAGIVGVDVRLGRFALHPTDAVASESHLRVDFAYGFSDDMGSGPYDRDACLARPLDAGATRITVSKTDPSADYKSVARALERWDALGRPNTVVEILDSARYRERVRIERWATEPAPPPSSRRGSDWRTWLVIQAANGCRPNLRLGDSTGPRSDFRIVGNHPDAVLTFNGILIEGGIDVQGGISELNFEHCTLVPGRALVGTGVSEQPGGYSIRQTPTARSPSMRVNITSSIVGAMRLPEGGELCIQDSIVQAPSGPAISWDPASGTTTPRHGPVLTIERSTVIGTVHVREVAYASETIFHDAVDALRVQSGCVRFSHVPEGSRTPQRYRCEPDLSLEGITGVVQRQRVRDSVRPVHTSLRYGDTAYGQLAEICSLRIRRGAESGTEMGAFARLNQPLREDALRIRLEEYLPFGLQAGFVYVT